jgi:ketosteroid isomerase-like protein
MLPKEVLNRWIEYFNKADFYAISGLYAGDAINHQVADEPVVGKQAIKNAFKNEFSQA